MAGFGHAPPVGLANSGAEASIDLDERQSEDAHMAFEALHMLADGHPERLFAMLHPVGGHLHPNRNPGRTMLNFYWLPEHGSAIFA